MEGKIDWNLTGINLITRDDRIVKDIKNKFRKRENFGVCTIGAGFRYEGMPENCMLSVSRWGDDEVKVSVLWLGNNITLPMIKEILEALKPDCYKGDDTYFYLWKEYSASYKLQIHMVPEYQFDYEMANKKAGGKYKYTYAKSLSLLYLSGIYPCTISCYPYRSPFVMDTMADDLEIRFSPFFQNSGNEKLIEDFKKTVSEARSEPHRRYYLEDILPFMCKVTGKDANTVGAFLNAEADYNIALGKRPSLNKVYYLKFKTGCPITEVQRLLNAEEDFYAVYHWGNAV